MITELWNGAIVDLGQRDLGPSFGGIKIGTVTKAIALHLLMLIASRSWLDAFAWFGDD